MAKLTFKNSNGTSFHGVSINTTVSKLREVIGDPQCEENSGDDKVNFEWDCETAEGDVFTIYDWKEYRSISENETIDFHIGGKDQLICNVAKSELKSQQI